MSSTVWLNANAPPGLSSSDTRMIGTATPNGPPHPLMSMDDRSNPTFSVAPAFAVERDPQQIGLLGGLHAERNGAALALRVAVQVEVVVVQHRLDGELLVVGEAGATVEGVDAGLVRGSCRAGS